MRILCLVLGFTFLLIPNAFAGALGWSVDVRLMEALFGCKGLTPVLNSTPAVNVGLGEHGEVRIAAPAARMLSVDSAKNVVFAAAPGSDLVIGAMNGTPRCVVEDSGEDPVPTWNPITLDRATYSFSVVFASNSESCRPDTSTVPSRGFLRTNHYALLVQNRITTLESRAEWAEERFYNTAQDCANANW